MTRDEIRTAGLLFGEELALGLIEPETLHRSEVQRAVRSLPVPSPLSRRYQLWQMRRGRLTYDRHGLQPLMVARRAVLSDAAAGRPKLLVRVDAFPHPGAASDPARLGTPAAAQTHAMLHDAGVPYLMSVTPRVADDPLEPRGDGWRAHDGAEHELLAQMRRDGVSFGVHGLDGRTNTTDARRPSEFTARKRDEVQDRLDTAQATLRDEALHADVFVPPYDRFDASCWPALASRFDVVCGGPHSVAGMGFHRTPTWRGDAVWLPAYAPLHGTATDVLRAVQRLVADGIGLWIPVVLPLADDERAMRELCALLGAGGLARSWEDFLLAVRASRQVALALDR